MAILELTNDWLANPPWTSGNADFDINAAVAPDLTMTAGRLHIAAPSGSANYLRAASSGPYDVNGIFVIQCSAKKDTSDFIFFEVDSWTIPASNTRAWFNLATGVIGNKTAGIISHSMVAEGNGWHRCQAQFQLGPSDVSGVIGFALADSNGDSTPSAAVSIFVHGARIGNIVLDPAIGSKGGPGLSFGSMGKMGA